ncbi:MAG TPA: DUF559 domain-containing protein [Propionibacteriaceae bacterium]|nr:DUF559 domain-containing protein [Propionibacteriaceae bacterium]
MTHEWDPGSLTDFLARRGADVAPGGVVSARLLRRTANPDRALAVLAEAGVLHRVRRGWYASAGAEPDVLTAVRAGGVLSCTSALKFHGVWTPLEDRVHARPARNEATLGAEVRQCSPHVRMPAPRVAVDDPAVALRVAAGCLGRDDLIACLDSAFYLGKVRPSEIRRIMQGAPRQGRQALHLTDLSESGTESLVRVRLRRRRLSVRTQVQIPGVGRVDMLIGPCVVLEVDSRAHHTDLVSYQRDRLRDLKLLASGYVVIRVTWEQVMFRWEEVEPLILAAAARHAAGSPGSGA